MNGNMTMDLKYQAHTNPKPTSRGPTLEVEESPTDWPRTRRQIYAKTGQSHRFF